MAVLEIGQPFFFEKRFLIGTWTQLFKNLLLHNQRNFKAKLKIIDTKGSIVYEDNLFGRYWQIDISLLAKGLYFVKIEMEGTQFDAKIEKL